ncbi:MAG TPA: hypothetical protein PLQ13_09305 [Candidatus Krumholzibacteria bacterium]|nr:hypothetical protein [Candidatus Krumholzibacteria bacterium]
MRYFEGRVFDRTTPERSGSTLPFDSVYGNDTYYFWCGELHWRKTRSFKRDGLVGVSVANRDVGTKAWYVLRDSVVYGVELKSHDEKLAATELARILECDGELAHAYTVRPRVEQLQGGQWSPLTAYQAPIFYTFRQLREDTTRLRLKVDLLEATYSRSFVAVTRPRDVDACARVRIARPHDGFWPPIPRDAPAFFSEFVADTVGVGEPMEIEVGVSGISHYFSFDLWPLCGGDQAAIRQGVAFERARSAPVNWEKCRGD